MLQIFRALLVAMPWLVWSEIAHAEPVTGFIVATLGSVGVGAATAATISGFILNTAFSVGLGFLARALSPAPDTPNKVFGTDITSRDPIASRRLIYGTVRVPGTMVYIKTTADNTYHHYVVVLGQGPIDSVQTVFFNDEALTLDSSGNVTSGSWSGNATIVAYTGTTTQAADANLIAASGGEWTAAHQGNGVAYLYVKLHWTSNLASVGLPNITAIVRGLKVYDPRTSTTAYSANPALCLRHYLTLSAAQGGGGYSAPTGIDDTNIIAQANICDTTVALANQFVGTGSIANNILTVTNVTSGILWVGQTITGTGIAANTAVVSIQQGTGGVGTYRVAISTAPTTVQTVASTTVSSVGTEKLYESHGIIQLDANSNAQAGIQQILATCAATPDPQGGTFKFYVGSWRGVVANLSESNLVGPIQAVSGVSGQTRFNAVKGQYLEPASRYTAASYPAVTSATFQTQDGGAQVFYDLPLPMTTSSAMAQRLAKIALYRQRLKTQVQITCSLEAFGIAVGDVIGFSFARYGWSAKQFEVITRTFSMNNDELVIVLMLRETSSAVYSWSTTEEQLRAATPSTSLTDWRVVAAPTGLGVTEELYLSGPLAGIKDRIKFNFTAPSDAFIQRFEAQYRPNGGATWYPIAATNASPAIVEDLPPATYNFQVRAINALGSVSDWASTTYTVLGKSAPPNNVSGFVAAIDPNIGVGLSWTANSDVDLAFYEIRVGSSWAASTLLVTGLKSTSYKIATIPTGTTIYQIKAVDTSGNYSITSASVTATIASRSAVSIYGAFVSNSLSLTWSASFSGSLSVAYYEVRQGSTYATATILGSITGLIYSVKVSWIGSQTFWITPVDIAGNFGTSASYVSSITAPNSVSVTSAFSTQNVTLSWSGVIGSLSTASYEIRQGSVYASAAILGTATGSTYSVKVSWAGTQRFWVTPTDIAGNIGSSSYTDVVVTAPSGLVISPSFIGQNLQLSWTAASGTLSVAYYEIRQGTTYATATILGTVSSSNYTIKANWSGAQRFWVTPVDISSNFGTSVSNDVTVTAPSAPTITTQVVDNFVMLYWTAATSTLPVVNYEIRRGSIYSSATVIGQISGLFDTIFETAQGTYTYWITAIDSAGNYGISASTATSVASPPDYVLNSNYNSTFSGTLTNLINYNGVMAGPFDPTETWQSHFTSRSWASPQDQINAGYPNYLMPSQATASYEETIDSGITLAATKITATLNSTIISGTVTVTPTISTKLLSTDAWTNYTNVSQIYATNFRYFKIRYDLADTVGSNLIQINGINTRLDTKLKNDGGMGTAVSTDTLGTTVNFNVSFINVSTITVTPQGTTAAFAVYNFAGGANPTSFTVYLYNTSGARVSGAFSWSAKGQGF